MRPAIIGVPPPSHSSHTHGRRKFANGTSDRKGLPKLVNKKRNSDRKGAPRLTNDAKKKCAVKSAKVVSDTDEEDTRIPSTQDESSCPENVTKTRKRKNKLGVGRLAKKARSAMVRSESSDDGDTVKPQAVAMGKQNKLTTGKAKGACGTTLSSDPATLSSDLSEEGDGVQQQNGKERTAGVKRMPTMPKRVHFSESTKTKSPLAPSEELPKGRLRLDVHLVHAYISIARARPRPAYNSPDNMPTSGKPAAGVTEEVSDSFQMRGKSSNIIFHGRKTNLVR